MTQHWLPFFPSVLFVCLLLLVHKCFWKSRLENRNICDWGRMRKGRIDGSTGECFRKVIEEIFFFVSNSIQKILLYVCECGKGVGESRIIHTPSNESNLGVADENHHNFFFLGRPCLCTM
jgi:hypothetical protein